MRKTLPSLAALARLDDPLSDRETLLKRLLIERPESRFLEWKHGLPLGPDATPRAKYRMVKTVAAFANTDGGFIVFGVDPRGGWIGLSDQELSRADAATLNEVINSCVTPEIPGITFGEVEHEARKFGVVHVPPSPRMPHVTPKEVFEDAAGKRGAILLARWAVYCRHGAKSDLATPEHYERILAKRTDMLREEMLRRVREIDIPREATKSTAVRVYRIAHDPVAVPVRVARKGEVANATLVHEELSENLFEGVNNLLTANTLLTEGRQQFAFGPEVYYRIYAERQQVDTSMDQLDLLARTGCLRLYAPCLYWLLLLDPIRAGHILRAMCEHPRSPQAHGFLRMVMLLGPAVATWVYERWHARWGRDSQPPEWYWTLQKMLRRTGVSDRRLLALRTTAAAKIKVADGTPTSVGEVLRAPKDAAAMLSRHCQRVSQGEKDLRPICRDLDIIAYGSDFEARGDIVAKALMQD